MKEEWSCKITKLKNGYLVEPSTEYDSTVVFEENDATTLEEMKTLAKVFRYLQDYFTVYNDKHVGVFLDIEVKQE